RRSPDRRRFRVANEVRSASRALACSAGAMRWDVLLPQAVPLARGKLGGQNCAGVINEIAEHDHENQHHQVQPDASLECEELELHYANAEEDKTDAGDPEQKFRALADSVPTNAVGLEAPRSIVIGEGAQDE